MTFSNKYILVIHLVFMTLSSSARDMTGMISGKVLSIDGEPIDYATVFLKGTDHSCQTDGKRSHR